jgi:MoxR-like ATPase
VVIGSEKDCDIVLSEKGVLPKHAALEKKNGVWGLHVLDISKPVEYEGKPVSELRLQHGITFSIGQVQMRFMTSKARIEVGLLPGESLQDEKNAVNKLKDAQGKIMAEMGKIIIGQKGVLEQIIVALFARGHCLLIGVPGLAKTLMVKTLAGTMDLGCHRIQFTPDLMPADITGTDILEEDSVSKTRRFRFNRGPIFTNILLADEINRTPPKTQAALLEAMQEQKVTTSGVTYDLPQPFLVLATQNPIEQEGTYPLPEAQLDRFMFCIHVDYPSAQEEEQILMDTTRDIPWEVERVLSAEAILQFQHLVRQVPVSKHVASYATSLVRSTRPGSKEAPDFVSRWVRWGAGPRAGQYLLLAAKSHVLLSGRQNVSCADVKQFALPVLRHRIFCNFVAASEGVTADTIVEKILSKTKEPQY